MVNLEPKDIHISSYNTKPQGSWDRSHYERGVTVIHLPTGIKVSIEQHKSQHKNRSEAITVLRDLVTPFNTGDIVFALGIESEIMDNIGYDYLGGGTFVFYNDIGIVHESEVSHTKVGYIYKMTKVLEEKLCKLEEGYCNEIDIITEQIKKLGRFYE